MGIQFSLFFRALNSPTFFTKLYCLLVFYDSENDVVAVFELSELYICHIIKFYNNIKIMNVINIKILWYSIPKMWKKIQQNLSKLWCISTPSFERFLSVALVETVEGWYWGGLVPPSPNIQFFSCVGMKPCSHNDVKMLAPPPEIVKSFRLCSVINSG